MASVSQDTLCTVQLYSIKQLARHGLSVPGYIVYRSVVQHYIVGSHGLSFTEYIVYSTVVQYTVQPQSVTEYIVYSPVVHFSLYSLRVSQNTLCTVQL